MMTAPHSRWAWTATLVLALPLASCSDTSSTAPAVGPSSTGLSVAAAPTPFIDGPVDIGGGRHLAARCTGSGSPTVLLEGGDDDTMESFSFAESDIAKVTRTCVYDRANLGGSDADPGPRGLDQLVGDLEGLVAAAEIPGPLVLVGMSGGGHIVAGYATRHPDQVAGMVLVEVPPPFPDPPAELVRVLQWDSPENVEKRDYLRVEQEAWAARRQIGKIPVTVISNEYTEAEIADAEFAEERPLLRTNVRRQRGWLVLSPRAEQLVVHTGHAVEEADPQLVVRAIVEVVEAARQG